MKWKVISTETFSKQFQKHKKNGDFIKILNNKIKRLQKEPENVGKYLSGRLYGYKSTRILKNLRLIFKIINKEQKVILMAIDHRKFNYKGFNFY